jgi:hypothetical protein
MRARLYRSEKHFWPFPAGWSSVIRELPKRLSCRRAALVARHFVGL